MNQAQFSAPRDLLSGPPRRTRRFCVIGQPQPELSDTLEDMKMERISDVNTLLDNQTTNDVIILIGPNIPSSIDVDLCMGSFTFICTQDCKVIPDKRVRCLYAHAKDRITHPRSITRSLSKVIKSHEYRLPWKDVERLTHDAMNRDYVVRVSGVFEPYHTVGFC
jgi:hypothetical protein